MSIVSVTNKSEWLRALWVALLAVVALLLGGCRDRDTIQVQLRTRVPTSEAMLQLHVDALVTGPVDGLQYRWFAVSGTCTPQVTESPSTVFRFAEGVARDRVTLEVMRGNRQVARTEVDVSFEADLARRFEAQSPAADVFIEITKVPPREPGGDHTRADIEGKVTGELSPDYRVVIYARAFDNWYIQPTVQALHPIRKDGTWATWTHTGDSYAALVVRSDFVPLVRLDVLPSVGGYIKARHVVEGRQ